MSPEQRANLSALADYLSNLPANYDRFGMEIFMGDSEDDYDRPRKLSGTRCGTTACAVGHGPSAGIPVRKSDSDWHAYSEGAFGLSNDEIDWDWCFSGHWAATDNTPQGAAERIRILLKSGCPEDALDQMRGDVPLSYRRDSDRSGEAMETAETGSTSGESAGRRHRPSSPSILNPHQE